MILPKKFGVYGPMSKLIFYVWLLRKLIILEMIKNLFRNETNMLELATGSSSDSLSCFRFKKM